MGHLRTGALPRTRRWRSIVRELSSGTGHSNTDVVAAKTLDATGRFLRLLPQDRGLQACFRFLVCLAIAGQSDDVRQAAAHLGIRIPGEGTKLDVSRALRAWLVDSGADQANPEVLALARQATVDTVVAWMNKHLEPAQLSFFTEIDPTAPWKKASTGSGFCELSRVFFAKLIALYLDYFLSRVASAELRTVASRRLFAKALRERAELVSQYALETSKLVQSFSAGWFNRHTLERIPTPAEIAAFLRHAFEKIREEFWREKEAASDDGRLL